MKVAVVAYDGCTWTEVAPTVAALGVQASVVGPSAAPVRTSEGPRLLPDLRYAELDPTDTVVLVPGGDPASVFDDPDLHRLLVRSVDSTVVGAICHGVLLLARAGACRGRRVTHTDVPKYAPGPEFAELLALAGPLFDGSTYVDQDVVVDGRLATAKPWAALDLARKVGRLAGLDRERLASRVRYLRGHRDASGGEPYVRFAAFLTERDGVPTSRQDIEAHVAHLRHLEETGRLELAGPFPGRRAGLVVMRGVSESEARALAEADPFVVNGVRDLELRRWLLSNDDDDHLL